MAIKVTIQMANVPNTSDGFYLSVASNEQSRSFMVLLTPLAVTDESKWYVEGVPSEDKEACVTGFRNVATDTYLTYNAADLSSKGYSYFEANGRDGNDESPPARFTCGGKVGPPLNGLYPVMLADDINAWFAFANDNVFQPVVTKSLARFTAGCRFAIAQ